MEAYIGPVRAGTLPAVIAVGPPVDDSELDRLIARASELIYYASGNLATRAYLGFLLADYFGGYVDPLTLPTPLTMADYRLGLSFAVSAQIEFWLEWGEDHAIVGLTGAATSGKIVISKLPGQVAPRALMHLMGLGLNPSKVAIR